MYNMMFWKLKQQTVVKNAILTIEGSNAISYLMNTVLGKDYTVTSVKTCTDAISNLQSDLNKDLIIMDISDSGSDNYELLEHIYSSSILKDIRTIVISDSADESLKNKTFALGASVFLTKPFDPIYLSHKVKDLIAADGKKIIRKRRNTFNLNIF